MPQGLKASPSKGMQIVCPVRRLLVRFVARTVACKSNEIYYKRRINTFEDWCEPKYKRRRSWWEQREKRVGKVYKRNEMRREKENLDFSGILMSCNIN